MELIPYGIGGSNLKIFDVSIEKDYLYFLKPKTIKIDYSTSENDLEINPKEWVKGDSLYHGDQMSMSFYDNYKSPVTYIDGKTVYYAIGGTTVASNPAFLKSNEK